MPVGTSLNLSSLPFPVSSPAIANIRSTLLITTKAISTIPESDSIPSTTIQNLPIAIHTINNRVSILIRVKSLLFWFHRTRFQIIPGIFFLSNRWPFPISVALSPIQLASIFYCSRSSSSVLIWSSNEITT